jgi:hypothetical protein
MTIQFLTCAGHQDRALHRSDELIRFLANKIFKEMMLLQLYIIFIKFAELKIVPKKDRTNIICANRVKKSRCRKKPYENGSSRKYRVNIQKT